MRACEEELLCPDHAETVEQLRPDGVSAGFAAVQ